MEEEKQGLGERLKKVGTLGGGIKFKDSMKRYYFGEAEPGGPMSKEKLFGCHGPLLIGMPAKHEIAAEASTSDTKQTLIRELTEQSGFTRREAENIVEDMLRNGTLQEINHPDLGKVLVFKGRR